MGRGHPGHPGLSLRRNQGNSCHRSKLLNQPIKKKKKKKKKKKAAQVYYTVRFHGSRK